MAAVGAGVWLRAPWGLCAGTPWFSSAWPLPGVMRPKESSKKQGQKPQISYDPALGPTWCDFCCILSVKTSPRTAKVKGKEIDSSSR